MIVKKNNKTVWLHETLDVPTNANTHIAKVGDEIKAFDFEPLEGRANCFIQGIVVEKGMTVRGYHGFTIEVTKKIVGGIERPIKNKIMLVPYDLAEQDYDNRITLIKKGVA